MQNDGAHHGCTTTTHSAIAVGCTQRSLVLFDVMVWPAPDLRVVYKAAADGLRGIGKCARVVVGLPERCAGLPPSSEGAIAGRGDRNGAV